MPGVNRMCWPAASAELIAATEKLSDRTIRKLLIGIDVPAALGHDVPVVFDRSAGTNTLYWPPASRYRNGFSRRVGVLAIVVYGTLGKVASLGAFVTPWKTMFHTPPPQPWAR